MARFSKLQCACEGRGTIGSYGGRNDAIFNDNYTDVMPPEKEVSTGVQGLNGRNLQVGYLCDWEKEDGFML
jgi:hypothetical protein